MQRHSRLRALWASVLQGVYLTALILALLAFALRIGQSVSDVRADGSTPADAISALAAWFRGEEDAQVGICP
jgi:hypothetical protein